MRRRARCRHRLHERKDIVNDLYAFVHLTLHAGVQPSQHPARVQDRLENMSKRISMTLSDLEYSAVVQAVGVIITTTGTTTNLTQYIRDAIIGAVCRDLKLNQLSDFEGIKKE